MTIILKTIWYFLVFNLFSANWETYFPRRIEEGITLLHMWLLLNLISYRQYVITIFSSLDCLVQPHFHTLEKLYSSLGLDSEFITYLKQSTSQFSSEEKNIILQMDEIHVKSDLSYKGGQIINPTLDTENPTKSVFAIMASSLHKKWSSIVHLIPLSKSTASELFPIISKVICDIELNGLSV